MIRRKTKAERQATAARKARHRRLYRRSVLRKGPSRSAQTRQRDAEKAAVIAETRAKVWARTRTCELSGVRLVGEAGELHEDPSRAQTRGRPIRERINERVCCRASASAHRDQTEHRAWVDFADPVQRFLGAYTVRRWVDDAPLFHQPARRAEQEG